MYGLAIDNVVEMRIVTAALKVVVASETENSDLFWALKGGGNGNFGVVIVSCVWLVVIRL
jgi:FAD/FMN-containing dehydrogenase